MKKSKMSNELNEANKQKHFQDMDNTSKDVTVDTSLTIRLIQLS